MNKHYLTGLLLVLMVAAGLWWLLYSPTPAKGTYDAFAACLAEKGFVMYGAEGCSHCQNEKRAFGDSFRLISYVQCPKEPQACVAKGVDRYPTWFTGTGEKLVGEQGLAKLAEKSGCLLPAKQ